MKKMLFAAAALVAVAGCDNDKATTAGGDGPPVTATPVPAPNGGDWSTIVKATPEGGFLMGNPEAKVKLVEYGSQTCPHCAEFDETGVKPLIENYVKKGLVSWEFRNYIFSPFDMTATLIARCGGEQSFFGMTRNLYASQADWLGKMQQIDQAAATQLQTLPAAQQFSRIADLGGLKQFAAQRGVPRAKVDQCLADEAATSKLVQMTTDANAIPNFKGTPSFQINGNLAQDTASWKDLEPKIKEELAS